MHTSHQHLPWAYFKIMVMQEKSPRIKVMNRIKCFLRLRHVLGGITDECFQCAAGGFKAFNVAVFSEAIFR